MNKTIHLKLTESEAGCLWLALDNLIYLGNDFKERLTKQQRQETLKIFSQLKEFNPLHRSF